MTYLITQIFIGLFIAFLVGLLIGWWFMRSAFKKASAAKEAAWEAEKAEIKQDAEKPMRKLLGELDAINSRYTDHLDGKAIIDMDSETVALAAPAASSAIAYSANETSAEISTDNSSALDTAIEVVTGTDDALEKPAGIVLYSSPEEATHIDDLKVINGIGPKFESILNGVGIYNYAQIAAWGEDEINWITQEIDDQTDRIRRDEWISQAKTLSNNVV